MASTKNRSLIEYLPIICFLLVWVPQYLYRAFYTNRVFYDFNSDVYLIMTAAVASYIGGFFFVRILKNSFLTENISLPLSKTIHYRENFISYVILILSFYFIFENLISVFISGSSISLARDDSLQDWSDGGIFVKIQSILINVTISMLVCHIVATYNRNNKVPVFLISYFILLSVAAYSRTHLLIGFSIIAIAFMKTKKNPIRIAFGFFLFFTILFMILSILTKDNSTSTLGALDIAKIQLETYFFGGISGFDFFYSVGNPSYNAVLTIPRFLHAALSLPSQAAPSFYEFVDTTPPINVFSSIYPPYHDFGTVGVSIMFFIYGSITSASCIASSRSNKLLPLMCAGFFVYATIMSVFDDQFLRGLPVFLMFLAGAALYQFVTTSRGGDVTSA